MEEKILCPACGAPLIPQAKFCGKCGYEIPVGRNEKPTESKQTENSPVAFHPTENNSDEMKRAEINPAVNGQVENKETEFIPLKVEPVKHKEMVSEVKYVEPENLFAQELPTWSIEPPMVAVRRKKI